MTLANFMLLMIAPAGALAIAAVLLATTGQHSPGPRHPGPAE
ncbi:hypothetical protein [Ancylobacter crimeensis]|nr:hypothetical protein [Ancylobacter crimeensis]